MANALAAYVLKLITDPAEEEIKMVCGVSSEIKKMEGNLHQLKAFLADAESRPIREESVQKWVTTLKGVMYDTTDILELKHLKDVEQQKKAEEQRMWVSVEEKMPRCCHPFFFCLRNPVFTFRIARRIKKLNKRLASVREEASLYNFNANFVPDNRAEAEEPRQTTSDFDESAIVGMNIEMDTKELAQEITNNESQNLKVVSIAGMAGVGKTTLAQKILKQTAIQEHFKVTIWLSVTQHFNETELLRMVIKQAGGEHRGEQDKTLLTRSLTDTLSANNFLLVMDDMWSVKAWDDVLRTPVVNSTSDREPDTRCGPSFHSIVAKAKPHTPFYAQY